jgi:hypothetical protein
LLVGAKEVSVLKSKWFVIIAALALLLLVAGCATQAGSEPSTTVPGATAPVVTEMPVASPEVAATDAVTATETVTVTDTVTATETITATETVTGTTGTETPEAVATVEMPELSEQVQRWAVLWDPEMAFEVRYPQGWVVGEADVTDADAPITRTYTLQPSDWAEDYPPISVEVVQGDEAAFEGKYGDFTGAEEREIGANLGYTSVMTGAEGAQDNLAVFESPYDPEIRVVLRDVITGNTERAEANADFAALIEGIVQSFRWRK